MRNDLEPVVIKGRTDAQSVTLASMERELAYSGRRFGGKSWIGCGKGFAYACAYSGARVAIAREERASMESTTLYTLREEIVPRAVWSQCWRESKSRLELPNGSVIDVVGLDKPERVLGSRYGLFVVDQAEQLSEAQFEIANSCVMQTGMPWHQLLLLFNPAGPDHWAYIRYRPDDGDGLRTDKFGETFARVVHVAREDMIDLLTPESRRRFDSLTGVFRDRLRLGLWVAAEGVVFAGSWDAKRHVVPRPSSWAKWGGNPPPDWTRYRGIDFGYSNPFVCAWYAEDPDGKLWRYREIYHSGIRTEEHGKTIVAVEEAELAALRAGIASEDDERLCARHRARLDVEMTVADHDPEAQATLAKYDIVCVNAVKDRRAGMEAVEAALVGDRVVFVQGSTVELDDVLREANKPTCTEAEIPRLRFSPDRDTKLEKSAHEGPVKHNDHGYDVLCYILCTRERVWRYT